MLAGSADEIESAKRQGKMAILIGLEGGHIIDSSIAVLRSLYELGARLLPEGMEDVSKIPNLVRGLMERGYSDEDVENVLGGNTLRVMREVEAVARRMQ